jgi:uncharacterized protein
MEYSSDMASRSSANGWENQAVVILAFALLCAGALKGPGIFGLWAMMLLLPCAIGFGGVQSVHLVLVFLAWSLMVHLGPATSAPLWGKVGGVGLYLYAALLVGPLRRSMKWAALGRVDGGSLLVMVGIVVLSAIGVIAWTHVAKQDPTIRSHILPAGVPSWLVPIYMVGFAGINAAIEEIIWRGVEMAALEAAFGAGILTLVLQAAHFGLAHYRGGFPNGWSGVGLTFMFGLAMGWLRRRTKGLLVPWCAHAAADFTIIWLVVHRVGM